MNNIVVCRDKSMDSHNDLKFFGILFCSLFVWTVPVFISVILPLLILDMDKISQSGSPQQIFYVCFMIFGLIASIALIWLWNRNYLYKLGNKSLFFVIDEDNLSFAYIGSGAMANYIRSQTSVIQRLKFTLALLVYLPFFLFPTRLNTSKFSFLQKTMLYKLELKEHFASDLLSSDKYQLCSNSIIAVRRLKFFGKGCSFDAVFLNNGVEQKHHFTIYSSTENYSLISEKLRMLSDTNSIHSEPLTPFQTAMLRKTIFRRIRLFGIALIILAVICVIRISSYMHQIQYDFLPMQWLAGRNINAVIRIVLFTLILTATVFGRYILDLFRTSQFSAAAADVVSWSRSDFSLRSVFSDFTCFADVRFNGKIIKVGAEKNLFINHEDSEFALILRNNVPYCIVKKSNG